MNEWELAQYLIEAKKDIDTILFIKFNQYELSNLDLNDKIKKIHQHFYISLCNLLDKTIIKKEICKENKIIDRIYHERDRNKAHDDKNYEKIRYKSINEIIQIMKKQISETKKTANNKLPTILSLDYVPHDKELFRYVYGISKSKEEKIKKIKYNREKFESQKFIFKKVFYDLDDIMNISEEQKKEYAVIVKNGINIFEGIQERQDACIKLNILYQEEKMNFWCKFNEKNINIWIKLKEKGFIDEFDIPSNIKIWSNEKWEELNNIMNEEE